jgi:hypothetical protein
MKFIKRPDSRAYLSACKCGCNAGDGHCYCHGGESGVKYESVS